MLRALGRGLGRSAVPAGFVLGALAAGCAGGTPETVAPVIRTTTTDTEPAAVPATRVTTTAAHRAASSPTTRAVPSGTSPAPSPATTTDVTIAAARPTTTVADPEEAPATDTPATTTTTTTTATAAGATTGTVDPDTATTTTPPTTATTVPPATTTPPTTATTVPPATTATTVPTAGVGPEVDDAEASEVGRRLPNDQLTLEPIDRLTGNLAPKSIVASGTGLYFAQNMMYVHTVSVFDETKQLIKTIDDSVDLKGFGYDVDGDTYQGAPVEAAFTSDGSFAFVSNYRMYGPGYDPQAGGDSCEKDQGQDSFVYRIDTESLEIDRVYPVGPIPKFLAVTPDDRFLLVSNWCGFDVTIIDLATHTPISEIEVGRYPRGIAVTSDGRTAYVAVMGSTDVAVIGLPAWATGRHRYEIPGVPLLLPYLSGVGASPRHLVLSPDDRILYATLNGEDAVVAVDVATGDVVGRVQTGHRPRSMDISDDGTALYVVNYESDTMSKIRTSDLTVLQQFTTAHHPIGITYDSLNDEVWVSTYSGVIHVFAERAGHGRDEFR